MTKHVHVKCCKDSCKDSTHRSKATDMPHKYDILMRDTIIRIRVLDD